MLVKEDLLERFNVDEPYIYVADKRFYQNGFSPDQ
jgi:hypothetical protein